MLKTLIHTHEQDVKFSEVDSLSVVWHGHYIRYFEDGREAFGKAYNIDYLTFYNNEFVTPIVNVQCDYKRFLKYGDRIIIETTYEPCEQAKMIFKYRITNAGTQDVVVTGSTIQVFLSRDSLTLQLINPDFFQAWKVNHGLTKQGHIK